MIQIRDDFVRAVQSVMERLKTDPSGAIDNEGIRTALLRQASSTPDNIACSEHVEYSVSPEKRLELKRTFGLKIVGKDALLSDIAYDLECEEVVDLLAARRPELSREEIEAALRVSTLLLSGLEIQMVSQDPVPIAGEGQTTMLGDAGKFAMEIGPLDPSHRSMRVVNTYVGGRNISETDNTVYLPQFVTSLRRAAEALKRKMDYASFEPLFLHQSLDEAYRQLVADQGEVFSACRVLDFGATTDGWLSFLIPYRGRLHLLTRSIDPDETDALPLVKVEVTAYDVVRVLELTIEMLESA